MTELLWNCLALVKQRIERMNSSFASQFLGTTKCKTSLAPYDAPVWSVHSDGDWLYGCRYPIQSSAIWHYHHIGYQLPDDPPSFFSKCNHVFLETLWLLATTYPLLPVLSKPNGNVLRLFPFLSKTSDILSNYCLFWAEINWTSFVLFSRYP